MLGLTKIWRADGSDDGPERKWPVGVAAGKLEHQVKQMTWNNMTVTAADAKFKKLMKDNGTLCAKYCGESRVRKDSANDHVLNVPSALWNDSLIFASVLLIVLFMLYFVMCAFFELLWK